MKKDSLKKLDALAQAKYKRFDKYYKNDSKKFINKISRDYEKFPVHILKQIKLIDKSKYDSAVCVLRGGLPYAVLFELFGWKVHYVLCGRKNEKIVNDKSELRFNKSVDGTINQIQGKKILIIDNNSPTGNTPTRVAEELINNFKIKKPDLFLDYFVWDKKKKMSWLKKPFWKNKKRLRKFGRVYEAKSLKVGKKGKERLLEELEQVL